MIRIITDSTCEGPPELFAHPAVTVVPLYVLFGTETLRDNVDISREEFWRRLPTADPKPSTSQATPADFLDPFRRYTDAGDEVVAVLISSKLSGTYASAIQARAELPGRPIDVIDSLSTSVALGLMFREVLEMVDAGASRPQIVDRLTEMRPHVLLSFTLDTLEYLARGGRIGKAQAFLATRLKLKPILGLKDGEIVPVARARGRRKALQDLVEHLGQQVPARGPKVKLAVTHAGVPEEAAVLREALRQQFDSSDITIAMFGPVLGTHVGPGTIGAAVWAGD